MDSDLMSTDWLVPTTEAPLAGELNGTDDCAEYVPIDIRKPWIAATYMYAFPALTLVGIPANLLSFTVIRLDQPFSTTRTLLLYLALVDTLVLLFEFPTFVLRTIYEVYNYRLLEWIAPADPVFYGLSNTAKFAQIWAIVIIAADRYCAICHPFRAVEFRTVRNAEKFCLFITVFSILLNLPRFASYHRIPAQCHNRTVLKVIDSELVNKYFPLYELIYNSIIDPILYYCVPLSALLFFTTCLILSVRKASAMRSQMNKHARHEANITVTLIAIVTTFIMCETPTVILFLLNLCMQIVDIAHGEGAAIQHMCYQVHEEETILCISILTLLLSSSNNFFLYILISQKFRGILCRLLRSDSFARVSVKSPQESVKSSRTQMHDAYYHELEQ